MQDHGGIGWLTVSRRRPEANLFCRLHGVVVQAVAQPAHNALYPQITGGLQNHLQQNLTFDPQLASLLSIDRGRLGNDFCRQHRTRGGFCRMRVDGRWRGNISVAEAAWLDRSMRRIVGPVIADSGVTTEARTRDYAGCPFGAATTVAVASTGWQIKGSHGGDVDGLPRIGLGGNSVGIAEASSLHLRRRARDGWSSGTAGGERVHRHNFGNYRRRIQRKRV